MRESKADSIILFQGEYNDLNKAFRDVGADGGAEIISKMFLKKISVTEEKRLIRQVLKRLQLRPSELISLFYIPLSL